MKEDIVPDYLVDVALSSPPGHSIAESEAPAAAVAAKSAELREQIDNVKNDPNLYFDEVRAHVIDNHEIHVEKMLDMITTATKAEELPNVIRVSAPAGNDSSDLVMHRYVNMACLPVEIKHIVWSIIKFDRPSDCEQENNLDELKAAVSKLQKRLEEVEVRSNK